MARKIKMKHVNIDSLDNPVYADGELVVQGSYNKLRLGDGKTAGGNPVSAGTLVEEFTQVVENASAGYVPSGQYGLNPVAPQEIEIYRGDNMLADNTGGDTAKDVDEDLFTEKSILLRRASGGTGAIDLPRWDFAGGVKTLYLRTLESEEDIVVHYRRDTTAKSITVTFEQPVMFKTLGPGIWTAWQSVA